MNRLAVRIVLPFALALLAACGFAAWALGRTVREGALADLHERTGLLAQGLARSAELPMLAGDTAALGELLEEAGRDPDVLDAVVVDAAGQRVAGLGKPEAPRLGSTATVLVLEEPVHTAPALGPEGSAFALDQGAAAPQRALGRVRLLVSMARTEARVAKLERQIGLAGVALLALCAAIGWATVRLVGRPLRQLVDATERIAGGDLAVRVSPSSTDEVGTLGRAFNRMAEDLAAERSELERRVEARTVELRRAQETLVQSEKLSAVGQLVAGVAHELNNPLTVVLGYSGLLVERTKEEDTRRKLQTVLQEAQRSQKIVQNLLAFARRQPPARSEADLNDAVARTVALRAYQLRSEKIRLDTDLQPDLPRTWADFQQLQQVILNLVVNAEQAIQESGRGSRIVVRTRAAQGSIRIDVEDDGPGIPESARTRLFEPFFTTKDVGKGTGLGLSICWGIVSEHGGKIEVDSAAGKFSRFTIVLPIHAKPAQDTGEATPQPVVAADPGQPRRRVLVVDDDRAVLQFVGDVLERSRAEVHPVQGGREAIARLARGEVYDVVLCDLRMPDLDGSAVFRYLCAHRPELEERVVFATGDLANEASASFLEGTGRPVLAKPFDVDALRALVEQVERV